MKRVFAISHARHSGPPKEILIVKPSSLGDIVHTLPSAALIKRQWPEARLHWLINSEWAPLLAGNPYVDEIVEFPRRTFRGLRGSLRIAPWAADLRRRLSADLVLDFQGLLRSALLSKLCKAPKGRVVGPSDAREGARLWYDEVADVSHCAHAVDRCLAIPVRLGIALPERSALGWPLPGGEPPAGAALPRRFILLHPFARGSGKSMSDGDVAAFCEAAAPLAVVIAGRVNRQAPRLPNVVDLLNRTSLLELIFAIRRAAFVVSVDSGPMHIAAALTDRLLAVHSWSDPIEYGPYRPLAWVWKGGQLCQVHDLRGVSGRLPAPDFRAVAEWTMRQIGQDVS